MDELSRFKLEKLKEKGTYFEGSDKNYPKVGLPKWMQQIEIEND